MILDDTHIQRRHRMSETDTLMCIYSGWVRDGMNSA